MYQWQRGNLWDLLTFILLQNIIKLKVDHLVQLKKFQKVSADWKPANVTLYHPVIFDKIQVTVVRNAATKTHGCYGPYGVHANGMTALAFQFQPIVDFTMSHTRAYLSENRHWRNRRWIFRALRVLLDSTWRKPRRRSHRCWRISEAAMNTEWPEAPRYKPATMSRSKMWKPTRHTQSQKWLRETRSSRRSAHWRKERF